MILKNLKISNINLGDNYPPVFFPDIGTFFNQNIILAKKLIDKLHINGAEIIKGEILHDPNIALKININEPYLKDNGKIKLENTRKLIERKIVKLSKYEEVFNHCKKKKLPFVLSVYDFKGADFAYDIGASALKIASSNIVHRPLIEYVTKYNIPIIIDTGKSSYDEINRSLNWFKRKNFKKIHIQHSPYAPPNPIKKHDLKMINTFKNFFGLTVGLSDHHHGNEMLYAAIALGANSVEKGIIASSIKNDQDVYHALDIDQFNYVNKMCKNVYFALGNEKRIMKKNEPKHSYRMGIVSSKFLKKGTKLNMSSIYFAFPKVGIPVENTFDIIGKKLKRDLKINSPIKWSDLNEVNIK